MAIPEKGTRAYVICEAIFKGGPQTIEQLVDQHESLGFKTRQDARNAVYRTTQSDHIRLREGLYELNHHMLAHFDPTANIVKPRTSNIFSTTLSAKHIPSAVGLREGSNDFKFWPSKHA